MASLCAHTLSSPCVWGAPAALCLRHVKCFRLQRLSQRYFEDSGARQLSAKNSRGKARMPLHTCTRAELNRVANLHAKKTGSISVPVLDDKLGVPRKITTFLQLPAGRQSMLNTKSLQKMEELDSNTFRCYLPSLEWLNFRIVPVADLRVVCSMEECVVELLSCKFEGSGPVGAVSPRFTASMRNHLTWSNNPGEVTVLQSVVDMHVAFEVFTLPFTLLPLSAVEGPGSSVLQVMLERLVPLFLAQLLEDYRSWLQSDIHSYLASVEDFQATTSNSELVS